MSVIKIQPNLLDDLKDYGAFNVSACFNCGTCTATCPLVENDSQFPRQIIRLAQLGQKEKLLGSKELWACYYCGDCSDSCPRNAQPGEFMAAARRYAIANYDVSGISKLTYKNPRLTTIFLAIIGVIIAGFAIFVDLFHPFGEEGPMLLGHYYYEAIHYVGMISGLLFAIFVVAGIWRMYQSIMSNDELHKRGYILNTISKVEQFKLRIRTLLDVAKDEFALQKRFKKDQQSHPKLGSKLTSRWTIHMSISWGFTGLMLATALDFIVKDMLLDQGGAAVPVYHPIRMLGIISGILLVYGTSWAMYFRYRHSSTYYADTTYSDWLFLWLLWGSGVTGFIVTAMVYVPENLLPSWAHWTLIIHIVVAAELLLMLPFSKFAHALYRPIALWLYESELRLITKIEEINEAESQAAELAVTT